MRSLRVSRRFLKGDLILSRMLDCEGLNENLGANVEAPLLELEKHGHLFLKY
jgi:hypothetical protein